MAPIEYVQQPVPHICLGEVLQLLVDMLHKHNLG